MVFLFLQEIQLKCDKIIHRFCINFSEACVMFHPNMIITISCGLDFDLEYKHLIKEPCGHGRRPCNGKHIPFGRDQ